MDFPHNYSFCLTDAQIKTHFPNLKKDKNFRFTSLQTEDYNCIAWASEITDTWVQEYDSNGNTLVDEISYLDYFRRLGFEITSNRNIEEDKIKIAVYIGTDSTQNQFKHVARLLPNGKWTSKLGGWEDIEHDTPEALAGKSYGEKIIIMDKLII